MAIVKLYYKVPTLCDMFVCVTERLLYLVGASPVIASSLTLYKKKLQGAMVTKCTRPELSGQMTSHTHANTNTHNHTHTQKG